LLFVHSIVINATKNKLQTVNQREATFFLIILTILPGMLISLRPRSVNLTSVLNRKNGFAVGKIGAKVAVA